jgi:hypothetical protein
MSSNDSVTRNISLIEEKPEVSPNLKTWHRPVISRIEIAQTLSGTAAANDGDGTPAS